MQLERRRKGLTNMVCILLYRDYVLLHKDSQARDFLLSCHRRGGAGPYRATLSAVGVSTWIGCGNIQRWRYRTRPATLPHLSLSGALSFLLPCVTPPHRDNTMLLTPAFVYPCGPALSRLPVAAQTYAYPPEPRGATISERMSNASVIVLRAHPDFSNAAYTIERSVSAGYRPQAAYIVLFCGGHAAAPGFVTPNKRTETRSRA